MSKPTLTALASVAFCCAAAAQTYEPVQVFSPEGRYLRSLANSPADLHGFVIRDAGDGEH